jgi:2-aminoadipate transaminase
LSANQPAAHGELIGFDSGHGFPPLFPDLTREAAAALTTYRDEALQYGSRAGLAELRHWIAGHLRGDGIAVAAEQILVTNGAKHSLELVCNVLLDEGDAVVVTAPTYQTAIPVFRAFGAEFIEIGQDDDGLDVVELAAELRNLERDGQPMPKLIYDIPDFHNPTGVTMTWARRAALVDLAQRHGIYLVEDSPYRTVRFEGEDQPPIAALDTAGIVLHLGTFSKLMAPGLRIGWLAGPPEIVLRAAQLKSDGGSSPLVQRIIADWCNGGKLPAQTAAARQTFRQHRDRMLAALRHDIPEASVTVPEGGYYLWISLPNGVDGDQLAQRAAGLGVAITPGSKCYAGGRRWPRNAGPPKHQIRLAYSHMAPDTIDDGISRLAQALRSLSQ